MKNFSDVVKCHVCGRSAQRKDTLLLDTAKGRFRLCRDCYSAYEESKLDERYETTKGNIKLYNIKDMDSYEIIKKQEKFIKDIKAGLYG